MNTILTDDERPKLPKSKRMGSYEEAGFLKYANGYTRQDMDAYADAREAAVLAKLREQEPFGWWHQGDTDEESDFHLGASGAGLGCRQCIPLYAAPQPAVVPPGYKLVPVEPTPEMSACIELSTANSLTQIYVAMLAAAPEAQAQPSVPTPWREAVKSLECDPPKDITSINLRLAYKQGWRAALHAAIARLDALGGVE